MKRLLALFVPLALAACQDAPHPAAPTDVLASEARGGGPAPVYLLTDLGTLGGNASFALGISNGGTVVGTSRTTSSFRPQIAFVWNDGEMTSLGSLPGSTFSRAFEINQRGTAVGEAFTPSPERSRAVIWENGAIQDIGTLPGATGAVANGINDRGQVAGVSGGRAFVWEDGVMQDLGTLSDNPAATSRGNAINQRGQVVGSSQTDVLSPFGSRVSHAFLWERGTMTDLGSLGGAGSFSAAFNVNESATVVGEAVVGQTSGGSSIYHAFVWNRGTMTDLHPAFGFTHSRAVEINASGSIVGHVANAYTSPLRAILWHRGNAIDLNDLLPQGSGWLLRSAEGINDRGQIVGFGTFGGETRAFLLTPR